MKRLLLIGLLCITSACSTVKNVNTAVNSINDAANALTPAAKSVQIMADETTLLESNAMPMIDSIKNVSDQANFSLILLANETTNTLVELQKTLVVAQQTLSNTTVLLNEAKQAVTGINSVVSNVPPVLNQLNKTLKSIRLTAVSVHKSQFEYHQFITDNWGKVVCGVVLLLLISVFHGLIQRLILGKRG